jgi:hypothetical protein
MIINTPANWLIHQQFPGEWLYSNNQSSFAAGADPMWFRGARALLNFEK